MNRTVLCVALVIAFPMKLLALAIGFPSLFRRVLLRPQSFFLSTRS